jgi:hydroxymethylpyrimidine pyrophosphatase-like HAD family hydrolase
LKLRGLFCDYDGTLAPLNVPRTRSRVPPSLAKTIQQIHEIIPVAIVTAKDYASVGVRTPFADAWACVYGVETITKKGESRVAIPLPDFSGALELAQGMPNHPYVEVKRTTSGEICGVCIEWKRKDAPGPEFLSANIARIRGLGLQVLQYSLYPMLDIIPRRHDKGVAVEVLREMLEIKTGLMYIGDTPADNPAFAQADVGIGIRSGWSEHTLDCDYLVNRRELGRFLTALLESDLRFTADLPSIRPRRY